MNLKSLLNKAKDTIKFHLAQPTMIFRDKDKVDGVREHVVREDEVTRPDLIALEYYGDHSLVDYLLKWNGISDPFSLAPGDVIQIPPSGIGYSKLERPAGFEENEIKNQFLQNKRLPKKDDRRIEALKKKYNKEVLLPPNVIPLGKKNYKFENGQVILGAQAQNDPVVNQVLSDISSSGAGVDGDGNNVVDLVQNEIVSSGTGGGTGQLTQTQLDNLLNQNACSGGATSGTGGGSSGAGSGQTATSPANNINKGDAPQSSNGASSISNDGAPCN